MAIRTSSLTLTVGPLPEPMRLDLYVVTANPTLSRTIFSRPDTALLVNGKAVKKSRLVREGDTIAVTYTEEFFEGLVAQPMELDILYEDRELLVINKAQGVVVHPGSGNWEHTLAHGLLARYGKEFSTIGDESRPGIVHRLDKDTSGVMVIARTPQSHRSLALQFKEREVEKIYVAVVRGRIEASSGSITANIKRDEHRRKEFVTCSGDEGRSARTDYRVIRRGAGWTALRVTLFTGRTHQIRVHLKSIGHPIIGDPIYGDGRGATLMLHALIIGFDHPVSGMRMRVIAPLPERIRALLAGSPVS